MSSIFFVNCTYSGLIWSSILAKFSITHQAFNNLEDCSSNFIMKCSQDRDGNLILGKLTISAFIWTMWGERNNTMQPQPSSRSKGPSHMSLEPPDSSQDGFFAGFMTDSKNSLSWTETVDHEDIFLVASFIIREAVKDSSNLTIYPESKIVRNAPTDPSNFPWKQRFQARKLASLVLNLNCSFYSNYNESVHPAL